MGIDEIHQSRTVRLVILQSLAILSGTSNATGLSQSQLHRSFYHNGQDVPIGEVRQELDDLVGDGLIRRERSEVLEGFYYKITSAGRDFVRADFPWEKIDEYTGRKA